MHIYNYIFAFTEEEDSEALASPNLVYGRDETDNVADESSVCSLDNGIQHAKQVDDTDENSDQVGAYRQMNLFNNACLSLIERQRW